MTSTVAASPLAGRKEWIGLAVIALPCLLYSMDLTVLNLALPRLGADLQPTSAQLLWIVDIYGFLVAGFLTTMGTLGDRIGRRRLLLMGAAAFGVASVLAAFSQRRDAHRGAGGAGHRGRDPGAVDPLADPEHVPRPTAAHGGRGVGDQLFGRGAMGPLLGGAMLQHFWWGSVFLLAVPVMVLLLLLGPTLLPDTEIRARRLDLISAALSLVAVLAGIYGMKVGRARAWAWWRGVDRAGAGAGGVFCGGNAARSAD